MPKRIRYRITITFKIPIVLGIRAQYGGNFSSNAGFFGNTNLHFFFINLKAQIRNLEIEKPSKQAGVMNESFVCA